MEIFGFKIEKKKNVSPQISPIPDVPRDGAEVIATDGNYSRGDIAGYFTHSFDINNLGKSTTEFITRYRSAALEPELELAINDIIDLSIASGYEEGSPVDIDMSDLDMSESIKKKILDEFETVLKLLKFNRNASDIFRQWYVDGRIYYHTIVDPKSPKNGIKEIRNVDPRNIRKIRELITKSDPATGIKTYETADEYYLYSENGFSQASSGLKISIDAMAYAPSGAISEDGKTVISYLHKSLRLLNQLRIMEHSLVIYRVSRAPERRIFYIDTGNLPKGKSEEYVSNIMAKYRNKITYNASTGEINESTKSMSMLEDFWLPRREGGKGTEITTLPGGQNLGEIEDILFFQKKLYKSLNIPISRLESDAVFSIGRGSEITRDEIKFQKFVNKLRKNFSVVFYDLLRIQLLAKKIINLDEWKNVEDAITFDFKEDNYYSELKEMEILRERVGLLGEIDSYVGRFFSNKWVKENILRMSDDDIAEMDKEIEEEKAAGIIPDEEGGEEEEAGAPAPPAKKAPPAPPADEEEPAEEEE